MGGHRRCGLAICTFHLGFSLALTLGQKATLHRGLATLYGRFISDKFRVFFAPTQMVVGLPRKVLKLGPALRYRSQVPLPRAAQRYIYSVTPVGHMKTTCIVVDSPSRLVLAGRSLIPTLMPSNGSLSKSS